MEIPEADLRVDVFRDVRSGMRACCVVVTHMPTGTTCTVDRHATLLANRAEALNELAARLASGSQNDDQ